MTAMIIHYDHEGHTSCRGCGSGSPQRHRVLTTYARQQCRCLTVKRWCSSVDKSYRSYSRQTIRSWCAVNLFQKHELRLLLYFKLLFYAVII